MSLVDDIKHAKSIRSKKAAKNFLRRRNGRWARINARRAALIHEDVYNDSLTDEEKKELESLQKLTSRLMELAFPRPKMDNLDRLIKKLEAKHAGTNSSGNEGEGSVAEA